MGHVGCVVSYPLVTAAGWQTRVLESGERTAPTVVFLHGLAARADRWIRNLMAVAQHGLRGVALDLPGHGFALRDAGELATIDGILAVLEAVIDEVRGRGGGHPVALVGSSIGGLYAARLAAARPDHYASLQLSAPMGLEPLGAQGRGNLAARLGDQSFEAVSRKVRALGIDDDRLAAQWAVEEHETNSTEASLDYLRALAAELESRLDEYLIDELLVGLAQAVPTRLYWGARDAVLDIGIGHRAADRLGLPLAVFEASGHAPYLSEATEFNRELLAALDASGVSQTVLSDPAR